MIKWNDKGEVPDLSTKIKKAVFNSKEVDDVPAALAVARMYSTDECRDDDKACEWYATASKSVFHALNCHRKDMDRSACGDVVAEGLDFMRVFHRNKKNHTEEQICIDKLRVLGYPEDITNAECKKRFDAEYIEYLQNIIDTTGDSEACNALGELLYYQGKFEKAEKQFKVNVRGKYWNAMTKYNLALLYFDRSTKKARDKAVRLFTQIAGDLTLHRNQYNVVNFALLYDDAYKDDYLLR